MAKDIEEIFSKIDEMKEINSSLYSEILHKVSEVESVFLFGAGREGVFVLKFLFENIKNFKAKKIYFVDSDLRKNGLNIYADVTCISPTKMLECASNNSVILITAIHYSIEIMNTIKEYLLGDKIYPQPCIDLYGRGFASFLYQYKNGEIYYTHKDLLLSSYELFEDELSKHIFYKMVMTRCSFENQVNHIVSLPQYFPTEIEERLGLHEIFLDCGAMFGDTVEEFIQKTNNVFDAIYSFEMDGEVYKNLLLNEKIIDSRIHLLNIGVSSENTKIEYTHGDGGASSYVARFEGECLHQAHAELRTIDSMVENGEIDKTVTFIKMDIEGAEMDALRGCQNLIQRDKPKLAICIYHKVEDLWEIPLYINSLVPEYKLIIRHHSNTMDYESVLYAYL